MSGNGRLHAQESVIAGLIAGLPYTEVAKRAGVSERTIRRWVADPRFRERLDTAKEEVLTRAINRLVGSTIEASETLAGLLQSEKESVKLAAAKAVLESATRFAHEVNRLIMDERHRRDLNALFPGLYGGNLRGGRYRGL